MGSLYKRGSVWWIKFYRDGKAFRESSGSSRKRDAQQLLRKREGDIARGTFAGLRPEKTTFEELAKDLVNDYSNNDRKATDLVKGYVQRLGQYFHGLKAIEITTDRIRAYINERRQVSGEEKPPANATINRELAALKRMFNLGLQAGKVVSVPHIPMLDESRNVRRGFFHHRDYLRLKKVLPSYLRPLLSMAYWTGMRRGEILSMQWDQVDLRAGLVRLEPGTTKNRSGRTIPIKGDLLEEMKAQRALRDKRFPFCRHVFFNHNTGKPIRDFRAAWKTACQKVGLKDALFHDLRRSGVRNLIRAGVPEKVAMAISGHKTRSVFDRYNIVSDDDLHAAARALETHFAHSTGTIRAQIREFDEKSGRDRTALSG